jgi:hypothetical protein
MKPSGIKRLLFLFSLFFSIAALYYLRPDAFSNPQFWGEEGSVFFADAYHYGFKSLFNVCHGYHQLFPRFIACSAQLIQIPYEYIPTVYVYSWLMVLITLISYIWFRLEIDNAKKIFISLILVIIPLQSEIIMNLTNVQWLLALFPVIIFSNSQLRNGKWFFIDLLILIFAGLTAPNFTILIPLFVFLLLKERKTIYQNKRRLTLFFLSIIFGLIELVSLLVNGDITRSEGTFKLFNFGFIKYFFLEYAYLFLGKSAIGLPAILIIIGGILFLLIIIYLLIKTYKSEKIFGFVALVSGMLFWIASVIAYRQEPESLNPYFTAPRNFYIPSVTFLWALVFIFKTNLRTIILFSGLILLFLIETIIFVGRRTFVDYSWKTYARRIPKQDTLKIPINPPGWFIEIDNSKKE